MKKFDEPFRKELKEAVSSLESASGVELVVALVPHVERYYVAHLASASIVSMGLLTVLMFMPAEVWYVKIYYETLIAFVMGFVLLFAFPITKRLMLGKKFLKRRVTEKARSTFLEARIHDTRHRTGVLTYVAFFERQVVIVADDVAEELVPPQEWEAMRQRFQDAFTSKDPAQAVIDAIKGSADAFRVFIPRTENDVNELPDELWVR